ncbi:MAG: TlpA family protein disulfide reductase [Bacteroidaceae bacterium]|nr:TlpA family protein disulfide reductase [Bacteroidaceae bacterium]
MKKLFLTLIVAFVTISVSAQEAGLSRDSVTISFQLASKAAGEKATLIFSDYTACDVVDLNPVTDKEGKWSVKLPADRTIHIQLWDDNKIEGVVWGALNLFCRPGTRAEILLDDINDRCIFSGENAAAHNAQVEHPLKIANFHGHMFGMDINDAAQHIRDIYKNNMYNIDTLYASNPSLPESYVESLRQMARYGYAFDMTQNIQGHFVESIGTILEQGGNTLPDEYVAMFREVETEELLCPKTHLPIDALKYFRDVHALEYYIQVGIISEVPEGVTDSKLHSFSTKCSVIDAINASDEIRQIMKAASFLTVCGQDVTPERKRKLQEELNPKTFSLLQGYIDSKKVNFESASEEEITALAEMPMDSIVNGKDIFQKLIAPYRGRVIYVDIWGTWCGPCLQEMQFLPQLHEELKNLPVTYMYLANNSPEELWGKATRRFGLEGTDCVNLRLPDAQQSAVEEYLGVQGFPTFLLVAPDGTVYSNKAPRPSFPTSVREAIQEMLK